MLDVITTRDTVTVTFAWLDENDLNCSAFPRDSLPSS